MFFFLKLFCQKNASVTLPKAHPLIVTVLPLSRLWRFDDCLMTRIVLLQVAWPAWQFDDEAEAWAWMTVGCGAIKRLGADVTLAHVAIN